MTFHFDPTHDLALANGVKHFTPPAFVARMQADLQVLDGWWDGPWGWNYDVRQAMLRAGVPINEVPTLDDLSTLRRLSSREQTVGLVKALAAPASGIEPPLCLTSAEGLHAALAEAVSQEKPLVLKTPWSSSGRGQLRYRPTGHPDADSAQMAALQRHGEAALRRWDCVMAERWYDGKQADFAMLFRIRKASVDWEGYSLFGTDDRGTYRNSLLASNDEIEHRLTLARGPESLPTAQTSPSGGPETSATISASLHDLRKAWQDDILPRLFAPLMGRDWEVGYVGVDMMTLSQTTPQGRRTVVHPCVEMNVRSTLGVVARHMFDRGLTHAKTGKLHIKARPDGHFVVETEVFGEKVAKSTDR